MKIRRSRQGNRKKGRKNATAQEQEKEKKKKKKKKKWVKEIDEHVT